MPRLARNGQRGSRDAKGWKGADLLVVLVGLEERPVAKAMTEKLKVVDLKEVYGDKATVYLWNKNVHSFPRRITGGIVWIEAVQAVAAVIDHRHGVLAYVMVLHPKDRFGDFQHIDIQNGAR